MTKLIEITKHSMIDPSEIASVEIKEKGTSESYGTYLSIIFKSGKDKNIPYINTGEDIESIIYNDFRSLVQVINESREQASNPDHDEKIWLETKLETTKEELNELAKTHFEKLTKVYYEILFNKCKKGAMFSQAIEHHFDSPTGRMDVDIKALTANLLHDMDRILDCTAEEREDRPELEMMIHTAVDEYIKNRTKLEQLDEATVAMLADFHGYKLIKQ